MTSILVSGSERVKNRIASDAKWEKSLLWTWPEYDWRNSGAGGAWEQQQQ